jgi:hypothetical protein
MEKGVSLRQHGRRGQFTQRRNADVLSIKCANDPHMSAVNLSHYRSGFRNEQSTAIGVQLGIPSTDEPAGGCEQAS